MTNMKLVITIDTEEDNWGDFCATGQTFNNIDRIQRLQELFDTYNVTPTYLITYPVATHEKSINLFMEIEKSGRCEIGAHCHPWNTPPLGEVLNEKNSMLYNLPRDMQYQKMRYLHNTIITNMGVHPVSFRSGRWGYDEGVAENLLKLGYKVDSSITSYTDWGDYHGPDFSAISPRPFRFSSKDSSREINDGQLIEIPATVGFLQKNCKTRNLLMKKLSKRPFSRFKLIGILQRMNLLNKIWLSPEMSDGNEMIKLAKCLMKKDYEVINMFFHSTTLKAGLNQFVRTISDEHEFIRRIKSLLCFAKDSGIESIKLSETVNLLSIESSLQTVKS